MVNTCYLLPEYEDDNQMEYLLNKYFEQIFDEQLNSWWLDPDAWPSKRDLKTFKEWFDVDIRSFSTLSINPYGWSNK